MTYKDILQTDYFFETYSKIEFLKRNYPVNHGFVHIWHVIKHAKNLAEIFKLSEKEKQLLLIACALHDIGYLNGRDEHAVNGAHAAKMFLQGKLCEDEINIICNAIACHGGKRLEDYYNNVSMCLILADKFDFDKTRYREDDNHVAIKMFMSIEKTELKQIDGGYNFEVYTTDISLFNNINSDYYFVKFNQILNNLYKARKIKIEIKLKQIEI